MSLAATPTRRAFHRVRLLSHPEHSQAGEDRWALDPGTGYLALCDGASEGWDSGRWAGCLATALAHRGPGEEALRQARAAFDRAAKTRIAATAQVPPGGGPEDWLAARARKRGSWATALVARPGPGGLSLQASAIGDTCLFVLDGFSCVYSFPLARAEDFTNAPALIGAEDSSLPAFATRTIRLASLHRPSFALATDALAARLLSGSLGEKRELWAFLARATDESFEAWAISEMDQGKLGRDDLSLLWVS